MSEDIIRAIDRSETEIGLFRLQERTIPGRTGDPILEILINDDMLMSTINVESEEALSTLSLAAHDGECELDVLVGGLGLGYTARAALADPRVRSVTVVDLVPAVIDWMRAGRFPLSAELNDEPRLTVRQADVYAELLSPHIDTPRYDLILIDIDHCPADPLDDENSEPFYTWEGQRQVIDHLKPGGVLGVWSTDDDLEFADVLDEVYVESRLHQIELQDEYIDEGERFQEIVYVARRD